MFVDSHAHLEMREFETDRAPVISRAADAGVDLIITVGTNLGLSRKAVALASQNENIFAAVGVHPHDVEKINSQTYDELKELVLNPKVVAYGEIGLDFFRNISSRKQQIERFAEQLQLAAEMNLPVIIHDRDAHNESLQMVKASSIRNGVFHCFSGDYDMAVKCLDLGFYISVPGVVTFAKAETLQNVVRKIPLESLLLETDCPYLTPNPHRGQRNEPAYIIHTANKVAEIKGLSLTEVASVTAQNTLRLFRIDPSDNK